MKRDNDGLIGLLTRQWGLQVLLVLKEGPQRFSELRRRVNGISAKTLTARLREFEKAGVVDREHRPTIPPTVIYNLRGGANGARLQSFLASLRECLAAWHAPDAQPTNRKRRTAG